MTCNVQNRPPGVDLEIIRSGGFAQYSEDQLKIIRFAELEGEAVRLTTDEVPNAVTAMYFSDLERVTDGFQAEFSFTYDAGTADGFALVIQDEKVENVFGNPGSALGFEDVFESYLAVGFDFCSDRPDCAEQSLRVDTRAINEASETVSSSSASNLFGVLEDAPVTVEVRVDYLADANQVHVFLDGSQTASLIAEDVDLSALLDTEFAFFGFSASNSNSQITNVKALNLAINNFEFTQMNSGFLMAEESLLTQRVDFGQIVLFSFDIVDTCNSPVPNATKLLESQVTGVLQDRNAAANTITFANLTQDDNGRVTLRFTTTANRAAIYDATIAVDGVLVQQNPLSSIVNAQQPFQEEGLSPGATAVIIASLLVLFLLLILFATRGFFKYKTKLDEHEEDIKYGRTKEEMDAIDAGIEYHMNPLVAPLDKLKQRLAVNQQVIRDMKSGQAVATDGAFTLEQLHAENEELRIRIHELKKDEEFANAAQAVSVVDDEEFVFIPPPKAEFGAEEDVERQSEEEEVDLSEVDPSILKLLDKKV